MDTQTELYYIFGPFRLEPEQGRLLLDGLVVPLTPKTFATLLALVRNSGKLVEKETLMRQLWPDTFVEEANLTFNVSVLRKALGENAQDGSYIETVPKRGYRFRAPVKEVREESQIKSIAVLPFTNAGSPPGTEYFAEGLHEALISELAQIRALRVMSRTSSIHCRTAGRPLPEFARDFNFDIAVEGSVFLEQDRARIDIRLLDARMDRHIWARGYERHFCDVLSFQRELAYEIARQVQVTLTRREEERLGGPSRTIDPDALAAFLRGRYYWHQYFTESGMRESMSHFRQAIQREPGYAQAWSGLVGCHAAMAVQSMVPPAEAATEGREAARKALELDPLSPDTHVSVAAVKLFFDWDWTGAERALATAIDLGPSHSMSHSLFTHYAAARGWGDLGIASARRALELDPMSATHNTDLGWAYLLNRDYQRAREQLVNTLRMDFNFPLARLILAQVYLQMGRFPEAIEELQTILPADESGPPPVVAMLGHALGANGDAPGAYRLLGALEEMAVRGYVSPFDRAILYAGLGEWDQTLLWLGRALDDRSPRVIWLKTEPAFDRLRPDPRFGNLVRRLALDE